MADRYWCHLCEQIVNPIMEVEMKCPFCDSGFIEEMSSVRSDARFGGNTNEDDMSSVRSDARFGGNTNEDDDEDDSDLSERSLSMIAPFFLEMMEARARRRRLRLTRVNNESDSDQDHELETLEIRRRRRQRSTAILQLLQNLSDNLGPDNETSERERESVILFNPANREILLQATFDSSNAEGNESNSASVGDYFLGPGMEILLQHLAENDPNRYGTPPAKKEAIDAMPTVKVEENLNCSVCLDDFEIGNEAKEMPCKHKFHSDCILPWLELHSTCPVCRFQIAAGEFKASNEPGSGDGDGDGDGGDRGNRSRSVFPWLVTGLYTSSRSRRGRNSSSNPSSSSTSESNSHEDGN